MENANVCCPISWEASHGIPIGMTFPWTILQVSVQVHYCKRDEAYFRTLLWQYNGRQNGLISQVLFFELYKIIKNKVTFEGFKNGAIAPLHLPLVQLYCLILIHESAI